MTSCDTSTSRSCCQLGIINSISDIVLIDGQTGRVGIDVENLKLFYACAANKFNSIVGDVPEELRAQFVKIFSTSTSATQEIFYIAFGTIAVTLFLLTLIIFAALYWRHKDYVIGFTFVLSLLIIIAAAIIAYFWITHVYNNASSIVTTNIDNIMQVVQLIQTGLPAAACCFGGFNCGPGEPCDCVRECVLSTSLSN